MSQLNYTLTVPSTVQAVSRSLAKQQLRVSIPDDDSLIDTYIAVATEHCERKTNRAFFPQTYQLFLDSFPYGDYRSTLPIANQEPNNYAAHPVNRVIRLPKPMCLSVTSIKYRDSTGTQQTLDPSLYYVDVHSRPARIVPSTGLTWPLTQLYLPGTIVVEYVAASFVSTITENVPLVPTPGVGLPFTGTLANQVVSILSVKDIGGTTLGYTAAATTDQNGDTTSTTLLSFSALPTSGIAVVTYQAALLPKTIVMAILLILGHLYENREETTELNLKTLPLGVDNFLKHHKFESFGNYQGGS